MPNNTELPPVDPKAYTLLLNTIADGESNGNYNAYFGRAENTEVLFTKMTVSQVLQWQKEFVDSGQPSSAVGKYQIIRPTLVGLVQQLNVESDALFDEALQDRMAIALLERRGAREFAYGTLSRDAFAANLAKEWAALPRITGQNPDESYYAGDGLNAARVTRDSVFVALATLKDQSAHNY